MEYYFLEEFSSLQSMSPYCPYFLFLLIWYFKMHFLNCCFSVYIFSRLHSKNSFIPPAYTQWESNCAKLSFLHRTFCWAPDHVPLRNLHLMYKKPIKFTVVKSKLINAPLPQIILLLSKHDLNSCQTHPHSLFFLHRHFHHHAQLSPLPQTYNWALYWCVFP